MIKRLVFVSILAVAALVARAGDAKPVKVVVEPQPIASAINELSKQSGLHIVIDSRAAAGITSNRVEGNLTAEDALGKLLEGTGLRYEYLGENSVQVVRAEGKPAASVPPSPPVSRLSQRELGSSAAAGQPTSDNQGNTQRSEQGGAIQLQEVIVTGTHIRGGEPNVSPVLLLDRQYLESTGSSTVAEVFERLPQNLANVSSDQNIGNVQRTGQTRNATGGTGINLRGLGAASTLILLNGRRLAPSAPGEYVDVSTIPLSAVDHIEVLTDGASAIYGADAVGGVVNFILRRDYDGAESRVKWSTVSDGGMNEWRVGQTLGTHWNSGHALLSYEYYDRSHLDSRDRSFASALPTPTDLIPASMSHSGLLSLEQSLTPGITASLDTTYNTNNLNRTAASATATGASSESSQLSVAGGLKAALGHDWQTRLDGTYGRSKVDRTLNTVTGPIPQDGWTTHLWSAEVSADGPLVALPAGDLRLAIGSSYRVEGLGETNPFFNVDDRKVRALYGELLLPLISAANRRPGAEALQLSAAVRREHYSDFGGTTVPKFGLRYEPVQGFSLRATYGKSFRAPLLTDLTGADFVPILFDLPDNSSPTGTTLAILTFGGTGHLRPERAQTWTVGFDLKLRVAPNWHASVNYFNIDYTGRIADPSLDPINILNESDIFASIIDRPPTLAQVNALLADPNFLDLHFLPYAPSDIAAVVRNERSNIAATRTDGLDVTLDYHIETGAGTWDTGLNATYYFSRDDAITNSSPFIDRLNITGYPVDFRAQAFARWSHAQLSLAGALNYTDKYRNNLVSPSVRIRSWTTLDLQARYDFAKSNASSLLDDTSAALSVRNALNRNPPPVDLVLDVASVGYDPANADPTGRLLALEITKRW